MHPPTFSTSSSVQAAVASLAARLRELRLDAGLNGRQLADRCGWSESKRSRLESAKRRPSDADIRAWCRACDAEDQAADLVVANRQLDAMYVQWRRQMRTGMRRLQEASVPLYQRTRRFRAYSSDLIPGLLQTPAYAAAVMRSLTAFAGTPDDDVAEAVAARMKRSQSVIREGDHRVVMLLEETALRHQLGDAEVMSGQLGQLMATMSLPTVSLGIIPFAAVRGILPMETFMVFDDRLARVELLTAKVTVSAPSEVADYVRAHRELQQLAVHGAQARELILRAIEALT
jgi:transcriptional regulator with XRE-family HTH domain